MKRTSIVLLAFATAFATAAPALAATSAADDAGAPITAKHVPDQVLVGFAPGSPAAERASARSSVGATAERLSPLAQDSELWTLSPGRSVESAIAALSRNPNIRYAEPNYILEATVANDPEYTNGGLWGMYGDSTSPANQFGSQAGEAWAAGATGSSSTYVVVIDEGIQVTHPDLATNMWTNPFDAIDGVDNDGNGYVDDTNGWDFVNNNRTVYDGGTSGSADSHGTHVAGTIGGVGNNSVGVVGVNWDVTMISTKFLGANGGTTANAARAVDYATDLKTRHGLNVVATSNSWGGGGYSQTLLDAIVRGGAQGILFVAAAGNLGTNNDVSASYPSGYNCRTGASSFDCVVSVAAIDSSGALAGFSQYGAATVDLGAPGVNVRSTLPFNSYGNYSGTSMATPHVSGAVALCSSMSGGLRGAALKTALLSSTAATSSLNGKTVTGGRLDMGSLASQCGTTATQPSTDPTVSGMSPASGPASTVVAIAGTNLTGASVRFGGTSVATSVNGAGTSATFTVPAATGAGVYAVSVVVGGSTLNAGSFTVTPPAPANLAAAPTKSSVSLSWAAVTGASSYQVRLGNANGNSWTSWTTANSTSAGYTGLRSRTTYTWEVRAIVNGVTGAAARSSFTTLR